MSTSDASAAELPLHGIRVLDLSGPAASYGARLLGDLGADVLKVERPTDERHPSLEFAFWNANKESVVIDHADTASLDALSRLGGGADVVIVTPTADDPVVGLDVDAHRLSWARRDAVVCCVTPFGLTGPHRDWRATHLTSYAMSGLMYGKGQGDGPPETPPGRQAYALVGAHLATAVMVALGQHDPGAGFIDMSVHEVLAHALFEFYGYASTARIERRGAAAPGGIIGVWQCADGPIEMAVSSDKQWQALRLLLGDPRELACEEWHDAAGRQSGYDEMLRTIKPLIAAMPRESFVGRGQELGVPCGLVNTLREFCEDPQPRARGFFMPVEVEGVGTIDAPGRAFVSDPALLQPFRRAAPALGATTVDSVISRWEMNTPPALQSLAGARILSFGTAIVGALTATTLAELGGDVVKIESPTHPDNLRGIWAPGERPAQEPGGAAVSALFAAFNRSIRSVELDMKSPDDWELFLRLAERADVVLENHGPGTMERWGLGADTLRKVNPRLVVLSITGFGQSPGPRSHYRAYGSTAWSFVGMHDLCGYTSGTHFDYIAEAHAVVAVVAGLVARNRTGAGTHIDLALVEAAGVAIGPQLLEAVLPGDSSTLHDGSSAPVATVVPCLGVDRWLAVELEHDEQRVALSRVIGLADDAATGRGPEASKLIQQLRRWAAARTPLQAARILQAAGIAAAPVQDGEDIYRDPQLRARQFFFELEHPDLGRMTHQGPPFRLSAPSNRCPRRTPRLGEHTAEVTAEWLDVAVGGRS